MMMGIYLKIAAALVLISALVGGGLYLNHAGYERGKAEITQQWDAQKLVDTLAVERQAVANANKLNESESKYEEQKRINDNLLAAQSNSLFVTAPACPASVSANVKTVAGSDSTSGSERPATVTVDFSDIESQVEQLGHDYNILAAKINAIAEENK